MYRFICIGKPIAYMIDGFRHSVGWAGSLEMSFLQMRRMTEFGQ